MIIGVTGLKGSGKDLAAQAICDAHGYRTDAFGAPLKLCCSIIFGIRYIEMVDRDLKESKLDRYPHQSPREVMQLFGTDAVRAIWPSAWVEAFLRRTNAGDKVVVTDCRFENEAEAIRSLGGKILRIERPGVGCDDHASETEMAAIVPDVTVINDGTAESLRECVLAAYDVLKHL